MLFAQRVENSSPPKIILSGVIDETTEFTRLLGGYGNSLAIYCKDIIRINSVGIKLWREFFSGFRKSGGKVSFFELSPSLVATLNYVSDFVNKSEVGSICAPFHCRGCNSVTLKIYSAAEAKELLKAVPIVNCEKCKSEAELDEIPEEYLAFLSS